MSREPDAGTLIRRARREAHLSQAEVAARAGVTQSVVAAYENGHRQPTVPTLRRLVEAAGATLRLSTGSPEEGEPARVRGGAASISAVAERMAEALAAGDRTGAWRWLLQFTDDFRGSSPEGRRRLVDRPPALVADGGHDAAVAALVEHLCAETATPVPGWTGEPARFASPWWFPAGLPALRAAALRDSPISFKRHGVFVTANAFDRA